MKEVIMLISATLGTLGFTLIYKTNPKHIPFATLGGILSCGVYLFFNATGLNVFVSNFIAMSVSAMVCEIFARILKAPAVIFLLPSVIPLVPGGSLYYTMSNLIFGNYEAVVFYGKTTLLTGLGIAAGMITASVIMAIISHYFLRDRKNKNKTIA